MHQRPYKITFAQGGEQVSFIFRYLIFKRLLSSSWIPRKVGIYHGSHFLTHFFKLFLEKIKIEHIYWTVGDLISNGLVESILYTIESSLLAM